MAIDIIATEEWNLEFGEWKIGEVTSTAREKEERTRRSWLLAGWRVRGARLNARQGSRGRSRGRPERPALAPIRIWNISHLNSEFSPPSRTFFLAEFAFL